MIGNEYFFICLLENATTKERGQYNPRSPISYHHRLTPASCFNKLHPFRNVNTLTSHARPTRMDQKKKRQVGKKVTKNRTCFARSADKKVQKS